MLGHRAIGEAAISEILDPISAEIQTVTRRFANRTFATRATDSPAHQTIEGRLAQGVSVERSLVTADGGQWGAWIESRFGEIVLANPDGALDHLADGQYADGRTVRFRIGTTEIDGPNRVRPVYVSSGPQAVTGDAGSDLELEYPSASNGGADIIPGDLLLAQISINDRGDGGALESVPAPWVAIAQDTNGALHQAILRHVADGTESGTTAAFPWQSNDAANDVALGVIHHFRYVDPTTPIEGLTAEIESNLASIDMPEVTTVAVNGLAIAAVSASDNCTYGSSLGESGGQWVRVGSPVAASTADDVSSRLEVAGMGTPGTITGGSIAFTPTDSPVSEHSIMRGFALRGLPTSGGRERVASYASFDLVYEAVLGPPRLDHALIRFPVLDRASLLQDRLQQATYGGGGGLDGKDEIAGLAKPMAFGECFNVAPQLIDPVLLIYQIHSGAIDGISAVYDAGIAYGSGAGDYATYAELEAAFVPSGFFATCLAEGVIRLGTAPSGRLTADVRGDAATFDARGYTDQHGGTMKKILMLYSPLADEEIDLDSFDALDTLQPASMGLFLPAGNDVSIADALAEIAFSCGAFLGQDGGLFRVARLDAPSTVADWAFTDRDIIEGAIERETLPYGVPWRRWQIGYARSWTVQDSGELALGTPESRKQLVAAEYRYAHVASADIALAHLSSAGAPPRGTLMRLGADAEAEADRLVALYDVGRALYRLEVRGALFQVRIGETVRLTYPRWNLGGGRNFTVVGVDDDVGEQRTVLRLFG